MITIFIAFFASWVHPAAEAFPLSCHQGNRIYFTEKVIINNTKSCATLQPGGRNHLHDFHVSKCLVEYDEEEKVLQISLHLFIDDLEEALRQQGSDNLFICTKKEAEEAEQYIQRYLVQNFHLSVNGRPLEYQFLGKEISEDLTAVWCYLWIPEVESLKELSVTNKILTEVYEDQKNIVSVFGPGNRKGLLLFQKGKNTESVSF